MSSVAAPRCALGHRKPIEAIIGTRCCERHSGGILRMLGDIGDWHALLAYELVLPRGTEAGNPDAKRPSRPHAPALTRLDVLAMLDPRTGPMLEPGDLPNLPYELGMWTDIVRDERHLAWNPADTEGKLRLLRAHHNWCIAQDWVPDYRDHLRLLASKLAAAVGQAPPRPFAHCIAITGEGECAGPLHLAGTPPSATCPRCRRVYEGTDLIRLRVITASERES